MNGGVNCPLVKRIADCRRVRLLTCALCKTEDWACALMKQVMDETGANGNAFIYKHISGTNHAHQIIGAFKWLRWAHPDYAIPQGLKKHEPLLTTTGHIINLGDDRLETQPTPSPPPQYVDEVSTIICKTNSMHTQVKSINHHHQSTFQHLSSHHVAQWVSNVDVTLATYHITITSTCFPPLHQW